MGCCSRLCCCLAAISLMWLLGVSWWVSQWLDMVFGSHLGVPCGLDLKSQSLVIESFSVGSRAVLSTTGESFGRSRFKVFYGPSF